jgi:hypothetical protein
LAVTRLLRAIVIVAPASLKAPPPFEKRARLRVTALSSSVTLPRFMMPAPFVPVTQRVMVVSSARWLLTTRRGNRRR